MRHAEDVILPTGHDPAVQRVIGHHRFIVGLDLGQAQDPSALVVIEDKQPVEWETPHKQRLGLHTRAVVWAERLRYARYPDIVRHVAKTLAKPPLCERVRLVVDATGVGRGVSDTFDEFGVEHTAVQMTAGMAETQIGKYSNVSKNLLLTNLASAFENEWLSIARDMPLREQLMLELESFQISFSQAGNQILSGGGTGHHADLAIATALAWWKSEKASGRFGSATLEGWY